MNSIPEMCLQYTEVFRAMRWEIFTAFVMGLLIGVAAHYLKDR